jgi:acyl-CoA synthetase (AMP-forming)/AMP-acid ligase II
MHTSTAIENSTTPTLPLDGIQYGKRLFPQVLEDAAAANPNDVIGMIAKSADISAGFTKVTYSQLSNAVNFTAWWIEAQIGRSELFETLAYVGIQDFRYLIIEIAAVKCGYKILLPSVRNSATNDEALFQSTKCSKLLFTSQFEAKVGSFAASMRGLNIFQVPSFDDMVTCPAKHYPYTKTWEEAKNDPIVIVHTSGTTGTPKAVLYNHTFVAFAADGVRLLPPANGRHVTSLAAFQGLAYCSVPFFHLGGFLFGLSTLFCDYTVVFGPSEAQASGNIVNAIMQELKIGAMMLVPNVCENLIKDHGEDFVTRSKALEVIFFLGGKLVICFTVTDREGPFPWYRLTNNTYRPSSTICWRFHYPEYRR